MFYYNNMDNLYINLKSQTDYRYKRYQPIYLTNSDFLNGTYTIDKPGIYILNESISFKPNENHDFLPNPLPSNCIENPFTLGFFAAIRICCQEVILDLNGFTLEQSLEHSIQQRFFSLIELADRPFPVGTGPANFGIKFHAAKMTTIRNGILGRRSHHGIHGNLCQDILIEDVKFRDFEISSISLNNFNRVVVKSCLIERNNKNIFVLGNYSASRFIRTFMREVIQKSKDKKIQELGLSLLSNIENKMKQVFTSIIKNKDTQDNLYSNPSKLADGNVFGMIFHGKFNINDFQDNREEEFNDLIVEDVTIKCIHNKVNEVIGLLDENGRVFTDPAGSVFQIESSTNKVNKTYVENVLAECQLFLAKYGDPELLCRSNLPTAKGLIEWKETGIDINTINQKYNYKYVCNGDSMHHVNKGIFGIKIDGGNNVKLKNIKIEDIKNYSVLGSNICGEYYKSHKKQSNTSIGYTGCHNRGISISASFNVSIENININDLYSSNGNCIGIDIFNTSEYCNLDYVNLSNIKTGTMKNKQWIGTSHEGKDEGYTINNPNKIPTGYGIRIDNSCCLQEVQNIKIQGDNIGPIKFIPFISGNNISHFSKTFV